MNENLKNEKSGNAPAANPEKAAGEMSEAEVDETLAESFPASDPPSWTRGSDHRAGKRSEKRRAAKETLSRNPS